MNAQVSASDAAHTILEPERDLSLENEQRLGMLLVQVQRRSDPTRLRANLDDPDLLDVSQKSHPELVVAGDALSLADLDERRSHESPA